MTAKNKNGSFEKLLKENLPSHAYQSVRLARVLASLIHLGQKRNDGSPYITHCDESLLICLRELGIVDPEIFIFIELHDTQETDNPVFGYDEIGMFFGQAIRRGVKTLTKERGKDYFASIKNADWRVQIAKIIEKLHNLRTLEGSRKERISHWLKETKEFYYPLAIQLANKVPKRLRKPVKKLAEEIAKAYWEGQKIV